MVEILAFVAHGFVGEGQSDGSTNERRSREENGAGKPAHLRLHLRSFELCSHTPSPIRRSFVRMRGTTATYADRWTVGLKFCLSEGSLENILMEGPLRKQGRWELPPPPTRYLGSQSQLQGLLFTKVENVRLDQKKQKQKQKRARNVSKAGVTAVK